MTTAVLALAGWELRSSLRSRSMRVTGVVFAALCLGVTLLGLRSVQTLGLAGTGSGMAALVALTMLLPPLVGILFGATSLAAARERGLLGMVAAQPVSSWAIVLGAFSGVAGSTAALLSVGLGTAFLVLGAVANFAEAGYMVTLLAAALGTTVAAVAIGVAVSSLSSGRSHAVAAALGLWFLFALGLDLMGIGLGIGMRVGPGGILALVLANPLEAGRVLAGMAATDGVGVGAFGDYVIARFGSTGARLLLAGSMVGWTAVSLLVARLALARRDV